jgi:hypothetical protein
MSQTMRIHCEAVRRIGRYLLGTQDKGFLVQSDTQQSFKCYVDAEYCGNWYPMYSEDPILAKNRTEYIMMYHGCPILWASRLQSAVTLSIMEFKYVALLTDWQDVIPVMHLLKECRIEATMWKMPSPSSANCLRIIVAFLSKQKLPRGNQECFT